MARFKWGSGSWSKPLTKPFDLLPAVSGGTNVPPRAESIACLLTLGEGWREAAKAVGGAFAGAGTTRLRASQEE